MPRGPVEATMKRIELTHKFITEYINEHGWAPTLNEIGEAIGGASKSTVSRYIDRLQALGYVTHLPRAQRAITVIVPYKEDDELFYGDPDLAPLT